MTAVMLIALAFALVGVQALKVQLRAMPEAQAETAQRPVAIWATLEQAAATHDGPGLRYAITGKLPAGLALEVVWEQDGWCKCLTYQSTEPVWVNGEYLEKAD